MSTLKERLAALREAIPKRAPKEPEPAGVIPAYLVRAAHTASWIAFFVLVYFLLIYTLDIARDRADALHLTQAGTWSGDLLFWFPHIVGYAGIAVGIPYVAKIAIPLFMSLSWKGTFWPKLWALLIAVAVSLVVIAGTFSVQGHAIVEKGRDAVVAEQARSDAIATLERQKANAKAELEAMTSTAMGSRFQAQAARAGVAGWDETIRQAKAGGDPMLPQIQRAKGSAVAADEIRQRIRDLDDKIGAAPQAAAVAERVETRSTGWLQGLMDWVDGARAILLSLVLDIVCLMMPWIALRLEQARNRQLAAAKGETFVDPVGEVRTPWADEAHMVPDLRKQKAPETAGMAGAQPEVFDAETGERLVKIKPREYYRRAGGKRKGEPVPMEMGPAEIKPDDKPVLGAHDDRVARVEQTGVESGDVADPFPDAAAELDDSSDPVGAGIVGGDDMVAGDDAGGNDEASVRGAADIDAPDAADLYAFLAQDPGPDPKGVTVYDEPIGPRQEPKALPNGEGVMLADVAAE